MRLFWWFSNKMKSSENRYFKSWCITYTCSIKQKFAWKLRGCMKAVRKSSKSRQNFCLKAMLRRLRTISAWNLNFYRFSKCFFSRPSRSLHFSSPGISTVFENLPKKSHSTLRAKRATFTSNSVTRQVTFNRTKISGKCQNWKIQMRYFEWTKVP